VTILSVLTVPDPSLKKISVPVDAFDSGLRSFIVDLEETMRAGPGGVGIASPQVGHFERIVIVDVSAKPKIKHHGRLVLINPDIVAWEGMVKGREGCMSVPNYTGNVIRAKKISLRAFDEYGKPLTYEFENYEARAVQHELDHLDGILFLDRLVSRRTDLYKRQERGEVKG